MPVSPAPGEAPSGTKLLDLRLSEYGAVAQQEELEPGPAPAIRLLSLRRVGVLLSYGLVGLVPALLDNASTVYTIRELNATPIQQNTIQAMGLLPWCLKSVFGLPVDATGQRKRWVLAGHVLAAIGLAVMGWLVDRGTMTVQLMAVFTLLITSAQISADVAADGICVELNYGQADSGWVQSVAYRIRYTANFAGALLGTCLYNKDEWGWGASFGQLCYAAAACAACCVPFFITIEEPPAGPGSGPLRAQLAALWAMVDNFSAWCPLLWIFGFNALQVGNPAWSSFLLDGIGLTPFQLGLVGSLSALMSLTGIAVYRTLMGGASWRIIFLVTTLVSAGFSCLQLLLVFQIPGKAGIPPFVFCLGDTAGGSLANGIHFMPMVLLALSLCPVQQEAASFGALTTFTNMGIMVGSFLGNLSSLIWDVSNEAMERHEYDGLWKLTLLLSLVQLLPLGMLWMLPASEQEQKERAANGSKSDKSSLMFVAIFGLSLIIAVVNVFWGTLAKTS